MIDGISSNPFQSLTLPPVPMPEDGVEIMEKVIRVSRERYTTQREIVEQKILKWSGNLENDIVGQEEHSEKRKNPTSRKTAKKSENFKSDDGLTKTKCDECGKEISVPFEPDGIRPVYCNDCFAKKKGEQELEKQAKKITLEDAFKPNNENPAEEKDDDDENYEPLHKER